LTFVEFLRSNKERKILSSFRQWRISISSRGFVLSEDRITIRKCINAT